MPCTLHLSSIDTDDEALSFANREDAIAHAAKWFVDGYNNSTIDDETRRQVASEVIKLEATLRAGHEFYGSRFHERAKIQDSDSEGQ